MRLSQQDRKKQPMAAFFYHELITFQSLEHPLNNQLAFGRRVMA